MRLFFTLVILTNLIFLSACAKKLNNQSPESVDLSGTWVLNDDYSQEVVRDRNGGGERNGPPEDIADRGRRAKKTPVMTAEEITITQNNDSMGIAYPKNQYRDIDWGKTKFWNKTVDAGWNSKNALIVETKSEHSNFIETYQLNSEGQVLVVTIDTNGNERGGEYLRVFTRKIEE